MGLIEPHGGTLRLLYLPADEATGFRPEAAEYPAWNLTQRQLCDLKLLLNGGFSPLAGFLGEADYEQVIERMRLADGTLWPIPVTLDVSRKFVDGLRPGPRIGLRDPEGFLIAAMTVESIFEPDRRREAEAVFGTTDEMHPGVDYLLNQTNPVYLGGALTGIARPVEYDFNQLRDDPKDLRAKFERWGWQRVVAFQTRNPMHRAHQELTQRAAKVAEANLLIHPVVDHAGPGSDRAGKPFYGPYDAQVLLQEVQGEIGIQMVPFKEMTYVQDRGQYVPQDEVKPGETVLGLSGTEFRRRLREGIEIPAWFSYPEVVEELRRRYPPKHRQGFTVLFTGLSGAGKSTLANALMVKLLELGGRSVTLLDGDLVRKHLSSELGFSKEHRDLNVLRIGFVASEIAKAGGVAICAPIAPYASIRRRVRELVEAYGSFVEIFVATPLDVCEQRDTKGLYAKARAGLLTHFTGIDDPYEAPEDPDVVIHTESELPDAAAQRIVLKLEALGLIK